MELATRVELERVVHIHSTRVIDRESGLALQLLAIPIASLEGQPSDLAEVARALELEILGEAPDPAASFLPHAVSAVLLSSEAHEAAEFFEAMMNTPPATGLEIDSAVLAFALHCAFADVIGIEESRLRQKVLAAIVGVGGSVALATMATITAPVALVVGAGLAAGAGTIIVFSAAAAVSERLYELIAG